MRAEDNETLVRTDRGTPMGELYRRFWIPALLSSELSEPDGAPVRLRILGEELVAFRDTAGQVGIIDAYCAHRGAPLAYGRNEDCGLRCLYHGWKYDTDGVCTDMPNIPRGDKAKEKVQITAYPTFEKAGMVWAYLGPAEEQPSIPGWPMFDVPDDHVFVDKYLIESNYLQGLEGEMDVSHARFLHSSLPGAPNRSADIRGRGPMGRIDGIPASVECRETSYGVRGVKQVPYGEVDQVSNWHCILPSFTTMGLAKDGTQANNLRVPVDDERHWWFRVRWSTDGFADGELEEYRDGNFVFARHEPGGWRPEANKSNGYLQDRERMKTLSFSGVENFLAQDFMMWEDQRGPIADRTKEHLVASDADIIAFRRRLLKEARNLAEGGSTTIPHDPASFRLQLARTELPSGTDVTPDVIAQLDKQAAV